MAGQTIGYIRVSSADQSSARQLDGIALDERFEDKASGKDKERPQLAALLRHARRGDTVVVHSMDRLARNLADLLAIVKELTGKGVSVRFVKEGQTFTGAADPFAQFQLSILGAVAEFERAIIRERQREGIALAVAAKDGRYKGRAPALSEQRAQELRQRLEAEPRVNRTRLAEEFGISRETLRKYAAQAA